MVSTPAQPWQIPLISLQDNSTCDSGIRSLTGYDSCPRAMAEELLVKVRHLGLRLIATNRAQCFALRLRHSSCGNLSVLSCFALPGSACSKLFGN